MPQASSERSRVGSPEDNGSQQSPSRGGGNGSGGRNAHSQQEEEVSFVSIPSFFLQSSKFDVPICPSERSDNLHHQNLLEQFKQIKKLHCPPPVHW